tara:strand:- start:534 stop:998 length:465 start_codon:yes stop_codon:yes gene_type:complete
MIDNYARSLIEELQDNGMDVVGYYIGESGKRSRAPKQDILDFLGTQVNGDVGWPHILVCYENQGEKQTVVATVGTELNIQVLSKSRLYAEAYDSSRNIIFLEGSVPTYLQRAATANNPGLDALLTFGKHSRKTSVAIVDARDIIEWWPTEPEYD